jgi:hypothetical protein
VRIYLAEWHDAWFDQDEAEHDWRDDYLVTTVGFLVRETEDIVSLAAEQLPDDEGFRAITHIPRALVERLVEIGGEGEATPASSVSITPTHPLSSIPAGIGQGEGGVEPGRVATVGAGGAAR